MSGIQSKVGKICNKDPVDRLKTCPLLLRIFYCAGCHNNISEYNHGKTPQNEVQIYTWMDATLKELTSLLQELTPITQQKGTFFEFAFVYPDSRRPTYRMREVGITCYGQKGADDSHTLQELSLCIGDYLDIAITPPYNPLMREIHSHPICRFKRVPY